MKALQFFFVMWTVMVNRRIAEGIWCTSSWHRQLKIDVKGGTTRWSSGRWNEGNEVKGSKTTPGKGITCNVMPRIEMSWIEIKPHVIFMTWPEMAWHHPLGGDFWSARLVLTRETTPWTSAFEDWPPVNEWRERDLWLIGFLNIPKKMKGWFLYSWSREKDWFVLVAKSSLGLALWHVFGTFFNFNQLHSSRKPSAGTTIKLFAPNASVGGRRWP